MADVLNNPSSPLAIAHAEIARLKDQLAQHIKREKITEQQQQQQGIDGQERMIIKLYGKQYGKQHGKQEGDNWKTKDWEGSEAHLWWSYVWHEAKKEEDPNPNPNPSNISTHTVYNTRRAPHIQNTYTAEGTHKSRTYEELVNDLDRQAIEIAATRQKMLLLDLNNRCD